MSRSASLLAIFTLLLTVPWAVQAQSRAPRGGLIRNDVANRVGLERSWFTRVQLDSARSRVAHVTQHISATDAFSAWEITHDRGKLIYTERDLDDFGDELGKEKAEKLAQEKFESLERAKLNPKMAVQVIPEITIYAMTDGGVVHAIDAQTGRTRWFTRVGNPNYPSEAPGANDQYVAVLNGSTIYTLNQKNGEIAWTRQVRGAPGAGPAVTDRLVFVPMANGAVEAYELDDHRQPPWIYKSHGRAVVQPIWTGYSVAWPTDVGHLYVAEGNDAAIQFRLEANDSIVAQAAQLAPSRIVVASTDGYVYCIDEQNGNLVWRFSTGEPIIRSPVVVGDFVYVVTDENNLFRLSAADGLDEWTINGVSGILSVSGTRLYCLGRVGRMVIVDSASGSKLATLPTETLDVQYLNTLTDRVIVGTSAGIIQCLHEIQNHWPVIHAPASEQPAKKATGKPAAGPAAARGAAPADANPFGADPFGSGGTPAAEPPASKPPAGEPSSNPFGDDPFGG
ncbi:MAG TPA: PQQ-binding-like beta-propeller repeat protein [Pirellulaceae bacterium]|nr:PQQ-binding-like beta-propeller repeat protein [Pirellulaceae bacterium]